MRPFLWRLIFLPPIPWANYLRVDHLIFLPLASYFCADHSILHSLKSQFCAFHLTLHPSVPWASYFCAGHLIFHPLASYFCAIYLWASYLHADLFNSQFARPFGELILYRPSLERVIFVPSIPWAHYFRANCLTLHISIDLASYFYQLFKSLFVRRLIFCYEFTSGSFGHL